MQTGVRELALNGTGGRPLQLADIFAAYTAQYGRHQPMLTNRNELHDATGGIDEESRAIIDAHWESVRQKGDVGA